MKYPIRGTIGTDGAANAFIDTDMDTGRSSIRVEVNVDVSIPTNQAQLVTEKWDRIASLRYEFRRRLKEVLSAA